MRNKALTATCLILCFVLSLGSALSVNAAKSGTFHFRAWIDGSDYVYIQNAGGKVWYEHIEYDYPGEHSQTGVTYSAESPAPTTLDGVNWTPTWDKTAKKSNTYTTSSPQNYPSGEWTAVSINKVTSTSDATQSRGPVTIEEYPSSTNSYTAKILINDDTGAIVYLGAAWYEFELSWEAPDGQVAGSPIDWTFLAIGLVVVAMVIAAILFVLLRKKKERS